MYLVVYIVYLLSDIKIPGFRRDFSLRTFFGSFGLRWAALLRAVGAGTRRHQKTPGMSCPDTA